MDNQNKAQEVDQKNSTEQKGNMQLVLEELDASQYLDAPKVEARTLDDYKKLKEDGTIFRQTFSVINNQNTLYAYTAGGVTLKMTSKHIDGFYHGKHAFNKSEALNKEYNVTVIDVVEDENLVYVSANVANAEPRAKMCALLNEGIESGEYKVVKARVVGITSNEQQPGREACLLNIGGLGIIGMIRLGEWSRCYTASFRTILQKEDIIRVAVIGTARWSSSDDPVYVCSRKVLLPENPWENIEEKLRVRSIVRVKCVDCHRDHFFGKIEGFEEINAYCFYPEDPECTIEVGKTYVGVIAKCNEKTRNLKVRFPKDIK